MIWLRHALAVAILPFMVAIVVPIWIARAGAMPAGVASGPPGLALQMASVVVGLPGLALFVSSVRRFAGDGAGTLAPWDPPRRLVVRGPYRYVRNPMISGVLFVLVAEALWLRSWPHAQWAGVFLLANAIFIPLVEEPQLRTRFGAAYREYCRHVPRILPRIRPWSAPPASAE